MSAMINIQASIEGTVPTDTSFYLSVASLFIYLAELVAITVFLKVQYRRGKLDDEK